MSPFCLQGPGHQGKEVKWPFPHLDPSLLLRLEPNNLIGKMCNAFVIWGTSPSNSFNFQARVGAKGLGFRVRAFSFCLEP
jgi:hypothetical protein